MAKTKSTDTASIVEEKNSTVEVETPVAEEKKEVPETKPEEKPEKPVTEKKPKTLGDKNIIKCESLAGKKLVLPERTVEFDAAGKCEVNKEEAEMLLTIPGYELAK